jgi:hypothetical protein
MSRSEQGRAGQMRKKFEKVKASQAHFSVELCCDGWGEVRRGEER